MAATITKLYENRSMTGGAKEVGFTVAGDAEYIANGYPFTLTTYFSTVYEVHVAKETDHGTIQAEYDRTNGKIYLRDLAVSGAQVTTSTDVSNLTFYVTVKGVDTTS